MKKRILNIALITSLFLGTVILSAGGSDGESLFKSKCGSCHKAGGEGKKVVQASRYPSKRWKRFFDRDKHKRKKDISGLITNDELMKVKEYLMLNAADARKAQEAGI